MMKTPVLKLSKYRPDFNDPRVKRRVRRVLEWARPILIRTRPSPVASAELTKEFGNQKGNLAAYLRANLLKQSGRYKVGKLFLDYSIKREGYDRLCAAIAAPIESDVEIARDLYGPIARGEIDVKYTEPTPGRRRYHRVQNLRKEVRADVFAGWYDYDIESAAPTLVLQYAKNSPTIPGMETGTEPYPTLERLVKDKATLRSEIAAATGLAASEVKRVVNGLFFGAKLQASPKTQIFSIVGGDKEALGRLKDSDAIGALTQEAKQMWDQVLEVDAGRRAGSASKKAQRRMAVYLSLEREAIEAMEVSLRASGVKYVLMHDGFMADRRVDVDLLVGAVRAKMGFRVSLSEAVLGENGGLGMEDEIDVLEGVDE
jgi:hypothetical protein